MIFHEDSFPSGGILLEKVNDKSSPYLYRFNNVIGQVQDEQNRNKRIYPKALWDKQLAEGSDFSRRKDEGKLVGTLGHPAPGKFDLAKSCIKVDSVTRDGNNVLINGGILKTPVGKVVGVLHEAKVQLGVSTRGGGNSTTKDDIETVDPKSYRCSAWDVVLDPGFANATMPLSEEFGELVEGATNEDLVAYEFVAESLGFENLTEEINKVKSSNLDRRLTMNELEKLEKMFNTLSAQMKTLTEAASPSHDDSKKVDLSPLSEGLNTLNAQLTETLKKYSDYDDLKESNRVMEEKYTENGACKLEAAERVIEKQLDVKEDLEEKVEKLTLAASSALKVISRQKMMYEQVLPKYPKAVTIVGNLAKCETIEEMENLASQVSDSKDESLPGKGESGSGDAPDNSGSDAGSGTSKYPLGLNESQAKQYGINEDDSTITARAKMTHALVPNGGGPRK